LHFFVGKEEAHKFQLLMLILVNTPVSGVEERRRQREKRGLYTLPP
jgi:hypothetical protein